MPKKRTPLSDDPWANEIEEEQQSRLQKIKSWAGNALLITVAGSLILVLGQLAGTGLSIMFGADDASDFAVSIEPINSVLFEVPAAVLFGGRGMSTTGDFSAVATISVEDFHPTLRPYKFNVFLRPLDVPRNVEIRITPKEVKAGDVSNMVIIYHHNFTSSYKSNEHPIFNEYPIVIEGSGGDGRKRNTTFFISTRFTEPVEMIDADSNPPMPTNPLVTSIVIGDGNLTSIEEDNADSDPMLTNMSQETSIVIGTAKAKHWWQFWK
jgi:hypothetical protein